jgi:preprotein translocase subunit SecG
MVATRSHPALVASGVGYSVRMQLAFELLIILTSVLLIALVLLHKGKGGGLSDLFGGGISSSLGGSSVAERNLNRMTLAVTLVWTAAIVGLGLLLAAGR